MSNSTSWKIFGSPGDSLGGEKIVALHNNNWFAATASTALSNKGQISR